MVEVSENWRSRLLRRVLVLALVFLGLSLVGLTAGYGRAWIGGAQGQASWTPSPAGPKRHQCPSPT